MPIYNDRSFVPSAVEITIATPEKAITVTIENGRQITNPFALSVSSTLLIGMHMSSALNDLRRWLRASPQPSASVDWTSIEAELGTALPLDYREFVDRFGGCRIQHLDICAPGGKRELSDGRAIVEGYFRFGLAEYRDAPGWPDHGKLLLWGDMDSDRLLCWDRGSADDPDEWRSVVFDTVGTLVRLEGNMTTCIRDIITGRQRPAILGRDFDKSKLWIDVDEGTYPIQLD